MAVRMPFFAQSLTVELVVVVVLVVVDVVVDVYSAGKANDGGQFTAKTLEQPSR